MEETKWSIVSFLLCIFCSGIFLTGCGMAYFTDNYVVTDDVLRLVIAFLLLDPLYLSVLCSFFGGGDMNGIALLFPEWAARCLFWCVASCKWSGIREVGTACLPAFFFSTMNL